MIKTLSISRYRKLKDIKLDFIPGVNILSGTNGTCKSSILHIISNSFQAVTRKSQSLLDAKCLTGINQINSICNPKIESLTRGDKKYNDPAPNHKGELYSVELTDGNTFSFRKHNSKTASEKSRYSVKPYYKARKTESLYAVPVIYLGLFRLFPYGEFQEDDRAHKITKTLPQSYLSEIADLYKAFTGYDISYTCPQKMGDIKKRTEFSTDKDGIDSNTVSAGEDNLFIILTALISLKYYFDSIQPNEKNSVESILLIDELDASLHPAFQLKLFELFKEYAHKYKIQIFFTTHSFALLKEAFKGKCNVTYFRDYIESVDVMDDADIFKIEMDLQQKLKKDLYFPSKIPIFSEDDEARCIINEIFDYLAKIDGDGFAKVHSYFHLVNASISSDHLKAIFTDDMLMRSTLRAICILDGDMEDNIGKCIMTLPGRSAPESFLFKYAKKIFDDQTDFWKSSPVADQGYTPIWCRDVFLKEVGEIEVKLNEIKGKGVSTHGKRRALSKPLFKNHIEFIRLLLRDWLHSGENKGEIEKFYDSLWVLFKKVSSFHGMQGIKWEKMDFCSTQDAE